jgi:alpha-D-xyloside xylohydrolase
MTWDDRRRVLRLAARKGRYAGMRTTKRLRIHRIGNGGPTLQSTPLREVVYTGRAMEVRLG